MFLYISRYNLSQQHYLFNIIILVNGLPAARDLACYKSVYVSYLTPGGEVTPQSVEGNCTLHKNEYLGNYSLAEGGRGMEYIDAQLLGKQNETIYQKHWYPGNKSDALS